MRLFTMIIWIGKGGLVFLSLILGVLITILVLSFLPSDPLADGYKIWYILKGIITTIVVALINYLFTNKFISEEIKVYIDEKTGEKIQVKDASHLFFIPNKYWNWIILIFGVIITIGSSSVY